MYTLTIYWRAGDFNKYYYNTYEQALISARGYKVAFGKQILNYSIERGKR